VQGGPKERATSEFSVIRIKARHWG